MEALRFRSLISPEESSVDGNGRNSRRRLPSHDLHKVSQAPVKAISVSLPDLFLGQLTAFYPFC